MTFKPMKRTSGNWRVMRNCCINGMCGDCRGGGFGQRPRRIEQATGYGEEYAKWVAANWSAYKATAEEVPHATQEG